MKTILRSIALIAALGSGCAPLSNISRHELNTGFYRMQTKSDEPVRVYADVDADSITIYQIPDQESRSPDLTKREVLKLIEITPEDRFAGCRFSKNSVDIDFSTIISKVRPSFSGVPPQLSSNINAAIYAGARKDYYTIFSERSLVKKTTTTIHHWGFDGGLFAGIGTTFVSPTFTDNNVQKEYDGIIFQKGAGLFLTIDNLSVGLTLGFDNLLNNDSGFWIYNNKPWLGLALGIANF